MAPTRRKVAWCPYTAPEHVDAALLTSLPRVRDCEDVPLPISSMPRRGVTLLELAVVLTIMGVAAALVTPILSTRTSADTPRAEIIAGARRQAIRRAEPLRLRIVDSGRWTLWAARDGVMLDSGTFTPASNPTAASTESFSASLDVLIDALGGCVPTSSVRSARTNVDVLPVASFDPLTCRDDRAELAR